MATFGKICSLSRQFHKFAHFTMIFKNRTIFRTIFALFSKIRIVYFLCVCLRVNFEAGNWFYVYMIGFAARTTGAGINILDLKFLWNTLQFVQEDFPIRSNMWGSFWLTDFSLVDSKCKYFIFNWAFGNLSAMPQNQISFNAIPAAATRRSTNFFFFYDILVL